MLRLFGMLAAATVLSGARSPMACRFWNMVDGLQDSFTRSLKPVSDASTWMGRVALDFGFVVVRPWYAQPGFIFCAGFAGTIIVCLLVLAVRDYRNRGRLIGQLVRAQMAAKAAKKAAER